MTLGPEIPLEPLVRVPKAWGEEEWLVNKDYCGKRLLLRQGHRCSLHFHRTKDEVFYLASGRVLLELGDAARILEPGQHVHVPAGIPHRFWGLEKSEILEFSTHHEDSDSYRVPGHLSGPFSEQELNARLGNAAPAGSSTARPSTASPGLLERHR